MTDCPSLGTQPGPGSLRTPSGNTLQRYCFRFSRATKGLLAPAGPQPSLLGVLWKNDALQAFKFKYFLLVFSLHNKQSSFHGGSVYTSSSCASASHPTSHLCSQPQHLAGDPARAQAKPRPAKPRPAKPRPRAPRARDGGGVSLAAPRPALAGGKMAAVSMSEALRRALWGRRAAAAAAASALRVPTR